MSKLHERTKLLKIKIPIRHFCTKTLFQEGTFLFEQTVLHGDTLARVENFFGHFNYYFFFILAFLSFKYNIIVTHDVFPRSVTYYNFFSYLFLYFFCLIFIFTITVTPNSYLRSVAFLFFN